VSFSLGGFRGMTIFAAGAPFSQEIDCTTKAALSAPPSIEIVGTGLTHDSLTQRYSINWKTDRAWGGTCRALDVRLADDTSHVAYFDFR